MLGFFESLVRDYGRIVQFNMGFQRFILLSEPEWIRDVVVTNAQKFEKRTAGQIARRILGNGLVTSRGDEHKRQRRLIQPGFHRSRLANFANAMVEAAERASREWHNGQARDVASDMVNLTLTIVLQTLFSTHHHEGIDAVGKAIPPVLRIDRFRFPGAALLLALPLQITTDLYRSRKTIDDFVYRLIRERRATGTDNGDLLSMLLKAEDADHPGEFMSDTEVRDQIMSLMLTGHETSAYALAWGMWLLATHPEEQLKLHAELDTVLGGRTPTLADLPLLKYTECVVRETLRLYCPVWGIGRYATQEHELGGFKIQPKTQLIISQWIVHRDPRYFPAPEIFQPGRWSAKLRENLPKFAYFPFGGGTHQCIGDGFAWIELPLVLATLAQRWRFALTAETRALPEPGITLRIRGGLKLLVEKRCATSA